MYKGKIFYIDGSQYEGEVKDTIFREGMGVLKDKNGVQIYDGLFRNNEMAQKFAVCDENFRLDIDVLNNNFNKIRYLEIKLDNLENF